MRGPHNIWRLIRTGATFERTGAMRVALDAVDAPPLIRIAARVMGWPFRWLGYRGDPSMPPVVRAVTALGPAYIKFGQLLSTRPDVAGEALAAELRVLQDRLPPFDTATARKMIEDDLGRPVDELFSEFSDPIAAASIAQVHRARLADDGREVAVKVLRPGIERAFRRDIDAFYFVAQVLEFLLPGTRRLRPRDVIAHFESVVLGELDLRMEAAAADEFRANTQGDPGFSVPAIHWHLCERNVLTLDWAEGINMGEVDALRDAGHDLKGIAAAIIQTFLRHALRDGYFHADMHQGNLKVAPNGDLIAFDFGIMGRIDAYTRRVYAEILMGFIRKDYRRVAEVHFEAGYVPADRDVDAFAQALRSVGEPIFGMDASQISMARLLAHLFDVTEQFGMQTRTELILLQRTMVVVEGVARTLDPAMNMWTVAQPVVEAYIRESLGPRAALRDLAEAARVIARHGPKLPALIDAAIKRLEDPPAPLAPAPRPARRAVWFLIGAASAVLLAAVVSAG